MDPIRIAGAIGGATKAFNTIKQGLRLVKIDQMAGQIENGCLQFLMLTKQKKKPKNPPLFKKLLYASSIEQARLEECSKKRSLNNKGMN